MDKTWFWDIVRNLFGMIDYVLYSLIQWIIQGIFDIANLSTSSEIFADVSSRIYIFLGIFMIFKISISLIKYLVSPDSLVDKEKGTGKFLGKTLGAMVLLIALPTIFGLMREAQSVFLPVVPKILFADAETTTNNMQSNISNTSNQMSVMILKTFFVPNYETADDGTVSYYAADITSLEEFKDNITSGHGGIIGIGDEYQYNYTIVVPTVVAIIIVAVLLGITVDVAIRVFKLIILELMAPIPVLSLIDIKPTKDLPFSAWVKQLTSTFLDIFVKLATVYIVLFFIEKLTNDTLFENYGEVQAGTFRMAYLRVLLIIGLLKFAKDAPKFVKESMGIKDKGDSGGILGALTGGALGAGAGLISGAISGRGLRGALTGAAAGMSNGFSSGLQGKKATAWTTAGDAAIQARTGNKDAKSGILAQLQRSAAKSQSKTAARRLGLTKATLDRNEEFMLGLKGEAARQKMLFEGIAKGGRLPDESEADFLTRRDAAFDAWQTADSEAAIAEANFNKADKAFEAFGLKTPFSKKYNTSIVHRATKTIQEGFEATTDTVTTSLGGTTFDERRRDSRDRMIDRSRERGGYNPEKRN